MIIIVIVLAFLSGVMKAMRDTIAHHWDRSIFDEIKNDKIRLWLWSNWMNRPDHWIWFLWDGWHFGDFFSYVFLGLSIGLMTFTYLNIIYLIVSWGIGFNLFYHKLFLVRQK